MELGGIGLNYKLEKKIIFETFSVWVDWMRLIFFLAGGPLPHFFLPKSFSYGQIRLHPKFRCPRPCGSALKVPGGVGNTNNDYHSSLS